LGKINLTDEDFRILSECINNQTEVPEDLLLKLSPGFFDKLRQAGKFDYKELDKYKIPTIEYAGKRPESVILAQAAITGGAAPLQIIRSFANGKNGDWKNLIVQGDNLQFLKTCYINQDPLIKDKVKGKVNLIYIDPPFATEDDFVSSDGVESYSDKIDNTEFLEGLRERIIYLKDLLDLDGSIYIHLDYRLVHYVKILLDEIFDRSNFRAECIWKSTSAHSNAKKYGNIHQNILYYARTNNPIWREVFVPYNAEYIENYFRYKDEKGRRFKSEDLTVPSRTEKNGFKFMGVVPSAKRGWAYSKEELQKMHDNGEIFITKNGFPRYKRYLDKTEGMLPQSIWDDKEVGTIGSWSSEEIVYPTQKPEGLLKRIIEISSNGGDLVLDCFAGSGTTAAVAEKLGRRWIVCDFGKHAIYTMQKRMLNIADSKKLGNGNKNEKYGQPPKPFCVVSAGAYDFSRIMNLRANKDAYISFVLGLFSIMSEDVNYTKKYKLPNIYAEKDNNPVEVYPVWDDEYLKNIRIDEDYLKGIIEASGGKLKGNYYIITPETCTVITDTTLKNSNKEAVNFKLLKFPYKVLEDVSRQFQIEEQPSSQGDINKLISSAGFYFNEEVKIKVKRANGGFKIVDFDTGILDKSRERFKGLDGLSMILIDRNYDGKVFEMDIAIYKKEIGEDGAVKVEGLSDKSHLIAIDKHGNESKITKI